MAAAGERVSISTRGGPTLSEAIRMTGLAASLRLTVSVSGKKPDTTNRSASNAPPATVK